MGLGITLGANGLLGELGGGGENGETVTAGGGSGSGRGRGWQGESIEATGGVEESLAPPVVKVGLCCTLSFSFLTVSLLSWTPVILVQSRASFRVGISIV